MNKPDIYSGQVHLTSVAIYGYKTFHSVESYFCDTCEKVWIG